MATSILKGDEWLSRKRARIWPRRSVEQAGFRRHAASRRSRNGLNQPGSCAQCHRVRIREELACAARDRRPSLPRVRTGARLDSGQSALAGRRDAGKSASVLASGATAPGWNGAASFAGPDRAGGLCDRPAREVQPDGADWESDDKATSAPAPVIPAVTDCRQPALPPVPPPPAPAPTTNQPAETWVPLGAWCKANGLAAPCRLAASASAGLRAEHNQRGLCPAHRQPGGALGRTGSPAGVRAADAGRAAVRPRARSEEDP